MQCRCKLNEGGGPAGGVHKIERMLAKIPTEIPWRLLAARALNAPTLNRNWYIVVLRNNGGKTCHCFGGKTCGEKWREGVKWRFEERNGGKN